jgi:thiol-disulfide isomerase/thioredoxin
MFSYAFSGTENTKSFIKGTIVDKKANEASGVRAVCYRLSGRFPCEVENTKTDSMGKYQFEVSANHTYEIHAGGKICTTTSSKEFDLKPGEPYQVEKLEVKLAVNSCKGRIVYEDGKPAENLPYGYLSKSFDSECTYRRSPPRTDDKGQFSIPHLLPDELFSLWVFPEENTMCVWKKLDPATQEYEFVIKSKDYIELPSDCLLYSTHKAIARQTTYAQNSQIQFALPDLHGNTISLGDRRFKNKAMLVNIYGSWCGGCLLEIPYLIDFKNKYEKQGLEVIGIAFEPGNDEEHVEAIKKISRKYNVNYPLLIGGSKETGNTNVGECIVGLKDFKGYPTTLYIDLNGTVQHIQVGFFINSEPHKKWQFKQMEENIQKILTENIVR